MRAAPPLPPPPTPFAEIFEAALDTWDWGLVEELNEVRIALKQGELSEATWREYVAEGRRMVDEASAEARKVVPFRAKK